MFSIELLLTGLLTGFASAPPSVELGSIVFREKKGTCYTNHIHRAIESKAAHLPSNTLPKLFTAAASRYSDVSHLESPTHTFTNVP